MSKFVLFVSLTCISIAALADDFVPFVIGDDSEVSLIAYTGLEPIAADADRIEVSGEYFVQDGKRIRIWGVNTSFSGNLPDHDQAERIAKRLAAAGINCVRLHHLDTSWWPNGLWNPTDGTTVYPAALERLDYFIDQLAQHGIWVNLNLHVGRDHSSYIGLPDPGTSYDKVAGIFTPALINAQKDFADTMLRHVNAYRGVRYADDPAVAFVEISNEDSFFMWNGQESLLNLPSYYMDILQGQYNAWLLARYGSTSALDTAWAQDLEPLGPNMVINGDFQNVGTNNFPTNWILEQHDTSTASGTVTKYISVDCLRLDVTNDDGVSWHLQINQPGLEVEDGRYYTFTFDAAASADRSIWASVMQAHDPWQNVGASYTANLTTEWQTFRIGFYATMDDANVRVNFAFGSDTPSVYLANVQLQTGGQNGLLEGEDLLLGNVALFIDTPGISRLRDEFRFLTETEKNYFDGMKNYIQNTIGSQALVTGTIVFGPLGLYAQSDMDFIDSHSYWRHPWFPQNSWDSYYWYVEQDAMTDYPDQATLFGMAANRLAGKPFTVTEYNHPAPNDYQAECVPMAATFAALHDWDGFWIYSYAHDADIIDDSYFNSFFDVANNPAKLGFFRAGAAIFLDEAVKPLQTERIINLSPTGDVLTDAVDLRLSYGNNLWSVIQTEGPVTWQDMLTEKCKVSFTPLTPATGSSPSTLNWTVSAGQGVYSAVSDGAWAFTGKADVFSGGTAGKMDLTSPAFAAVTVTALDELPLAQSQTALVTASGRCENTDMIFYEDRRTVHTDWGQTPVRIEAVTGTLQLPPGRWKAFPLGPDGTKTGVANIIYEDGQGSLTIRPGFGTMWYLLERQPADFENLALDKTVEVSSAQPGFEAEYAVDGDLTTRWSSEPADPQYLIIDLGQTYSFNAVRLLWDYAYGSQFLIQTSEDKTEWLTIVDEQNGDGDVDEYSVQANARYIRIYATQPATSSGYSLAEVEVYQCDCFDTSNLSKFAEYWRQTDCSLYDQCEGTDRDNDDTVTLSDLLDLVRMWLSPNCFGL
jgi:hypothetical protein